MKKYYLQVNEENIITDAITFPYGDYIEIKAEKLPRGVYDGWFKLENGKIIECPELRPEDPQTELEELKLRQLESELEIDLRLSKIELGL